MSSDREINLLPLRFRQRVAARRILTAWGWVAAAMTVVCGIQITLVYNGHQIHRGRVASLRETSQPVLAALEQRDLLNARHQELLGSRNRLDALIPSDDLLQTLGAIATATVDSAATGARIQSLRIDLSGATAQPTAPAKLTASPTTHVTFTAVAQDEVSLSQLISRLRLNERFREVRLGGTAEHDAVGGRRAEVEAAVLVEKELPQ